MFYNFLCISDVIPPWLIPMYFISFEYPLIFAIDFFFPPGLCFGYWSEMHAETKHVACFGGHDVQ